MANLKQNQQGIAAVLVSIILVLVIGLIIYSFSEVSRTNQNEALVNQLGQQAFDAANTAADIAANNVNKQAVNSPYTIHTSSTCSDTYYLNQVGTGPSPNGTLSSKNNVIVTCLLVNPVPINLQASATSVNNSIVWELNPGSTQISTLNFSWQGDPNAATTCAGTFDQFPTYSNYACDVPILNVDVFQDNSAAFPSISNNPGTPQLAAYLNQYTANFFIQPVNSTTFPGLPAADTSQDAIPTSFPTVTYTNTSNAGSPNYPNNANYISNPRVFMCEVTTDVATSKDICHATIHLPAFTGIYYVRIAPMYEEATNITLTPEDSSNNPIPIADAQAVIDVTARSQNAARRIQLRVRLPVPNGFTNPLILPNNAIESTQNICKLLDINATSPNAETDYCAPPDL